MKIGTPGMSIVKPGLFQRDVAFDSAQGSQINIDFPKETQWKILIRHIRIELDDGNWEIPVGYIRFDLNGGNFKSFLVTTKQNGNDGICPISFPDISEKAKVLTTLRGKSNAGRSTFTPKVLDRQFTEVQFSSLYLIFTIFEEDGNA